MRKSELNPTTPWGKWVKGVLEKHALWVRSQKPRTGIPHSTVVSWLQDTPPRPEGVIRFAVGFAEDAHEALQIAGYDPAEIIPIPVQRYSAEDVTGEQSFPLRQLAVMLLASRGMTPEDAAKRAGLTVEQVRAICDGYIPPREELVQFVQSFTMDVNEWLELAGYEPIQSASDPQQRLAAGLEALSEKYQTASWESQGGTQGLTDAKVDQILEWAERKLQQEEKRGKQG